MNQGNRNKEDIESCARKDVCWREIDVCNAVLKADPYE